MDTLPIEIMEEIMKNLNIRDRLAYECTSLINFYNIYFMNTKAMNKLNLKLDRFDYESDSESDCGDCGDCGRCEYKYERTMLGPIEKEEYIDKFPKKHGYDYWSISYMQYNRDSFNPDYILEQLYLCQDYDFDDE